MSDNHATDEDIELARIKGINSAIRGDTAVRLAAVGAVSYVAYRLYNLLSQNVTFEVDTTKEN